LLLDQFDVRVHADLHTAKNDELKHVVPNGFGEAAQLVQLEGQPVAVVVFYIGQLLEGDVPHEVGKHPALPEVQDGAFGLEVEAELVLDQAGVDQAVQVEVLGEVVVEDDQAVALVERILELPHFDDVLVLQEVHARYLVLLQLHPVEFVLFPAAFRAFLLLPLLEPLLVAHAEHLVLLVSYGDALLLLEKHLVFLLLYLDL